LPGPEQLPLPLRDRLSLVSADLPFRGMYGRKRGTTLDVQTPFRRLANVLRNAQQRAIEVANHPEKQKRLRSFSAAEITALLGLPSSRLGPFGRRLSGGRFASRPMLSFADIEAVRQDLWKRTNDHRFQPQRQDDEHLAVVAFINFKGGVGKTTGATHFAQYLALAGYRVLLADLDHQGSATTIFGLDPSTQVDETNSFAGWVLGKSKDQAEAAALIHPTYWPTIHLLAGGPVLQDAEFALQSTAAGGPPEVHALGDFLRTVGHAYDVVVLDTRPDIASLTMNALHAATGLVVPTRAHMVDLGSARELFEFLDSYIETARKLWGPHELQFDFVRVLPTMVDGSPAQTALLHMMRTNFADAILEADMVHTTIVGTAGVSRETLYEYMPATDRKAYDRAIAAMTTVNHAIEAEVLRAWKRSVTGSGSADARRAQA
jgi:chromosome partitioning protein